jgi:hypothetical protein
VGRTDVRSSLQGIAIKTEPCKRYLLAAQYHGSLEHEWQVVVQSVEDIGECRKKSFAAASK